MLKLLPYFTARSHWPYFRIEYSVLSLRYQESKLGLFALVAFIYPCPNGVKGLPIILMVFCVMMPVTFRRASRDTVILIHVFQGSTRSYIFCRTDNSLTKRVFNDQLQQTVVLGRYPTAETQWKRLPNSNYYRNNSRTIPDVYLRNSISKAMPAEGYR